MKFLVTGWFSFEKMGASAGDFLARDVVCSWLEKSGYHYDIALADPFKNGIDWEVVNPEDYSGLIFVCGPFGNGPPLTEFLPRFQNVPLIGINLSMLQSLDEWNPFDLLIERDSNVDARPDLVFLSEQGQVPVIGKVLVHLQKEYGNKSKHHEVNEILNRFLDSREAAVVNIDTRLDENNSGLRTPAEVESLIARMDCVITTRLHGMVLAIKNGVPPIVIDPVAGGAKILKQANAIGWPMVFTADQINAENLQSAMNFCLTQEGKQEALNIRNNAVKKLGNVRELFLARLSEVTSVEV